MIRAGWIKETDYLVTERDVDYASSAWVFAGGSTNPDNPRPYW